MGELMDEVPGQAQEVLRGAAAEPPEHRAVYERPQDQRHHDEDEAHRGCTSQVEPTGTAVSASWDNTA